MAVIRVAKRSVRGERKAPGYLDAFGGNSNFLKLLVSAEW